MNQEQIERYLDKILKDANRDIGIRWTIRESIPTPRENVPQI